MISRPSARPETVATRQMSALRPKAREVAGLLRALGNPERLLLLCELSPGEQCVSRLAERTGIAQPTLSQQLGVLRERRLVATRREGRQIFYSIGDPRTLRLLRALHGLYCGRVARRRSARGQ